ncbi:MAG TPA: YceI family protein [Gemmatimonadales bacterium]|nr:YceI family protein [Gemmatimonadales bacterium]
MSGVRWIVGVVGVGVATALGAQERAADSVVYRLSPASQFEVKTAKAGVLGFAGHDHLVRARTASGRIVLYPARPADARVEIVIPVESLEVLTPPDTAEIRKVTQAMRTDVLRLEQYPLITFVSTSAQPADSGFAIEGRLTLAGATRDVGVQVRVAFAGDTLRALGSFSVKQTDFGIRPYRGGPAGTVRVADRVRIEFTAVGVREAGP